MAGGAMDEAGAGVVVTRDEGPDGPLSALLADRGFRVLHWPTIRFVPLEDDQPLRAARAELDAFDWAVFTSPRAVAAVQGGLGGQAIGEVEQPASLRVAAIGESTAAALTDAGWTVQVVPAEATGDALVGALEDAGVGAGDRVLFPASAIAHDVVPDGLKRLGADVLEVVAYRTVVPPLDAAICRAALESGEAAVLTFTSPSTVRNLHAGLGPDTFGLAVRTTRAVAIGPTTAEAVRAAGWSAVAVAEPHSLEGLADRVAALAGRDTIQEAL